MSLIIANIITTLGAFALVYFAAIKDKRKIKLKSINKQLKEFYIPFYIMYNKNFIIPIINFSAISPEIQLKFMKLFLCKIYLMEPLSQSLVNEFYLNYLEFENYKANGFDSKTKFIDYQNESDMKFIEVSKVILREYKKLLKNIRLPIPKI